MVRRIVVLAALAAASVPAVARADQIAARDAAGNVFIHDASGTRLLTKGSDHHAFFGAVSESDNGTVLALDTNSSYIFRFGQQGNLLGTIPTAGSQHAFSVFGPFAIAASPDGAKVAYSFSGPGGEQTQVLDMAGNINPNVTTDFQDPSWINNNALVLRGPLSGAFGTAATNTATGAVWFSDPAKDSTVFYTADPAVNRQGTVFAYVGGAGHTGTTRDELRIFSMNGPPPLHGSDPTNVPTYRCTVQASNPSSASNGIYSPTFSPDGKSLAYQDARSTWTVSVANLSNCSTLRPTMVIQYGQTPSWSAYGSGTVSPSGGGTTAPATQAQIKALLASKITPHGKAARIGPLLKQGGYRVSFKAPTAGRVVIQWDFLPTRGHLTKQVLVATVTRTFRTAKTARILVRLTANGRRLLNDYVRLALIAKGSFFPNAGGMVNATNGPFTIKR